MESEILKGRWTEIKGEARKYWGKLTDDDWSEVQGNAEILSGKLQKYYGYSKERANEAIRDFGRTLQQ